MATDLSASFAIAWGIPVDIVDLTANLQAYVDTKKTLTAFRFCAQHGQGPDAHISKVPPELVAMIEDYVIEHARSHTRPSLSQNYKCFKAECTLKDHTEAPHSARQDQNLDLEDHREYLETCEECRLEQDFCDLHGNTTLGEDFLYDVIYDEHRTRNHEWSDQMESLWNVEPCSRHSRPGELAKALLKNFGLQAIISDHSLKWDEGKLASAIKWDLGPDPLKVTLCLLTLPCVVAYEQTESKYNDIIDGMDDPPTHTSFLIDPASLRLRKKDRKLFQRAMQILSLKPFVHPSRMQHRLSARLKKPTRVDQETFNRPDCDSKRIAAAQATLKTRKFRLEHAEWPQLMNIVSSRLSSFQ